jgi:enamine deaminase RidA (YjgF/YER057c/UK114 family)
MSNAKYFSANPGARRAGIAHDLVTVGDLGFIAGLLPIDLANDKTALPESVEEQLLKVLSNLESILRPHEMTRQNVVSVTIHLINFKRFHERLNEAYVGFFENGRQPVRSVVGVDQLPRGALVSLDFIVHKN